LVGDVRGEAKAAAHQGKAAVTGHQAEPSAKFVRSAGLTAVNAGTGLISGDNGLSSSTAAATLSVADPIFGVDPTNPLQQGIVKNALPAATTSRAVKRSVSWEITAETGGARSYSNPHHSRSAPY
jgi:hypothetical protein